MSALQRRIHRNATADETVAGLDLTGKIIAVTGCNAGIGLQTARALATTGARVYLAVRSEAKAKHAADEIRASHPVADVRPMILDLASLTSVRAAIAAFDEDHLDVLICNAGLYGGSYAQTEEGIERTVGVCHVGHAALALGLLDKLEASTTARVVMVSSESHRTPRRLNFDKFPMTAGNYRSLVAYGQAKLCNVLFANELDRRYADRGIRASSLHPGTLMTTSIGRDSALARFAIRVAAPFTKSLSQGAATTVWVATGPELEGLGGRYYRNCKEVPATVEANDPAVAARLWEMTEHWLAT